MPIHQIGGSICSSSRHRPSYHRRAQPAGSGPQSKADKEGSWSGLSHIPPPLQKQIIVGGVQVQVRMCANASLGLHPEGHPLLFWAHLFCPPPFLRISRWSQTCKFNKYNFTLLLPPFSLYVPYTLPQCVFPGKHYDGVVIGKTL